MEHHITIAAATAAAIPPIPIAIVTCIAWVKQNEVERLRHAGKCTGAADRWMSQASAYALPVGGCYGEGLLSAGGYACITRGC